MAEIFVSYSRDDRDRIAGLVSGLIDIGWSVFFDADIKPGETFRQRIQEELEQALVVIVVWSKSSVVSPWVCDEADYARTSGRRLLPLRIEPVQPPLGLRQFHALDFASDEMHKNSAVFRRLVSQLMETLRDPRDAFASEDPRNREVLRQQHTSFRDALLNWEQRDTVGGGAERKADELARYQRPARRYVVDAEGRGDFRDIQSAVELAVDGDVVVVRPGIYRGSIVVDKDIEMIGDGVRGEVVLESEQQYVMCLRASRCRVSGLSLRRNGPVANGTWTLLVESGESQVDNCEISGVASACLAIVGPKACPKIVGNMVHDGTEVGVLVMNTSGVLLVDNEIANNGRQGAFANIEVRTASPQVVRNVIHSGGGPGILISEKSAGAYVNNEIMTNMKSGLEVVDSNPSVTGNHIHHGYHAGVFISRLGGGVYDGNRIHGHPKPCVSIQGGAGGIVFTKNDISDSDAAGVYVQSCVAVDFESNVISDSRLFGFWILEGEVRFVGNRLMRNLGPAISVGGRVRGLFEDNDLAGSASRWDIDADCRDSVKMVGNRG